MKIWLVDVGNELWPSLRRRPDGIEVDVSQETVSRWQDAERAYQRAQDEMRALVPAKFRIVRIGRQENSVDMVDAVAKHKVWLESVVVGYMHTFVRNPEDLRSEWKIYYRFCDIRMKPRGGEFSDKDDVRDWVRAEFR